MSSSEKEDKETQTEQTSSSSSSSSSPSPSIFPLLLIFHPPAPVPPPARRTPTRLQKKKEKWALYNLDTMPVDIMIHILSYLHICQLETAANVFKLPRVSKKMYNLMKELFHDKCFVKPMLIKNVICPCSDKKLSVLHSLQITSDTCNFHGDVQKCPKCEDYYCLHKDNWCQRNNCTCCHECCKIHMRCDNKCIECEMFFSDIANEINDEMGYDSDDSEYFVEEDIISSCPCNDGTMCTYCHDG